MALAEPRRIDSPNDPRLDRMGREQVTGADQILARLAATPDERLDSLIALVEFVHDTREALSRQSR